MGVCFWGGAGAAEGVAGFGGGEAWAICTGTFCGAASSCCDLAVGAFV